MPTLDAKRPQLPTISGGSHGFLKSHFAPAFLFLPAERRQALRSVYAFFRVVDDAVDVSGHDTVSYLDAWRAVLKSHRPESVDPWQQAGIARALLDAIDRYGVPKSALEDFIDKGVAVDLITNRFETAMDTEAYCYGVAGTVGLACLPIFGAPVEEARDFAVRLGIAVQWINTIRDVGIDARLNRIYIPKDHLERFGCLEADILGGKSTREFLALMAHEAQVARSHHRRALELFPERWRRELRPALMMGRIYLDLLEKIERQGYPVFTKRVALNIVEKVGSTWRAIRDVK